MRAVYFERHGGPDVLRVGTRPAPSPGRDEVAVRLDAAALNHLDLWVRGGLPGLTPPLPHVCGSDGTGIVCELGPGAAQILDAEGTEGVAEGERVVINPGLSCRACRSCRAGEHSLCRAFRLVGEHADGTFAERVIVPAWNVHPAPAHLAPAEAAALTLAHVTAWRMLVTRGRLRAGETVLVKGIGGGVALAALQLAVGLGATVVVSSRDPTKLARARALGAADGIDAGEPLPKRARELTEGRGFDVVVDSIGGDGWTDSLGALARGGRLVTCGATAGARPQTQIQRIFWNQLEVIGSTMGSDADLAQMLAFVARTKLVPVVDRIYPLEEAPAAYARLEAGAQLGKIVLAIDQEGA